MSENSFAASFRHLPRNVKVSIMILPLWAIAFNLVNSYASLYMINQGISPREVGLINTVSFIVKTLLSVFSSYIINRFGRRATFGVVDLIGWSLPMFLWFMADNFWMFLAAALFNCVSVINAVTNTCFLVEDVEPGDRIKAFNLFSGCGALCALFVPVTGLLVGHYGLVQTVRYLYFYAFISMGMGGICKLLFQRETSIGRAMKKEKKFQVNLFKGGKKTARYILKNRKLVILLLVSVLINFNNIIYGLFFFPFLTKSLGVPDSTVSLFPFVITVISLSMYFLIIPKIRNAVGPVVFSILLYLAGTLLLVCAANFNPWIALGANVICWGIANAIMNPVLQTLIANLLHDDMRTDVLGFFNMILMLCMFPAGYVGGWLYEFSTVYPFFLMFGFYLMGFVLLLYMKRHKTAKII